MQINFEPEQIKAAHAYVDRLSPKKVAKLKKIIKKEKNKISTEEKASFFKNILNFIFK